ncbi:Thymidylate kinase [Penicillium subrubescens]|uniref:Thymidylate kinase n=1 Tax=Penicillium subrubescens TaxID=1316194 RepID=A0A1Q5TLA1_9EURO|nr:Thymidylate kinase [Penicillium subrubescens]KAJ5906683.1 Thymidylate kinase [Penicillium subrubescens]OKP01008.1 Thymidylate kinase [Penicillium subrubescens]
MTASQQTPTRRGALVVVEGLDRAGKSSQCELLRDYLSEQGHNVKYIRFPDRTTPIGKLIDSYLRGSANQDDHSIHLLFSANRWELAKSIEQDIAAGITLIVDRYSYSGAVYSAAKANPTLSLDWAWQPEIGLPQPDICLFLSISAEEAAKRGGFGAERYENETMQTRVRGLFRTLFERQKNVCVVDAGKTLEEVSRDIQAAVAVCVAQLDTVGPLRTLGPLAN